MLFREWGILGSFGGVFFGDLYNVKENVKRDYGFGWGVNIRV